MQRVKLGLVCLSWLCLASAASAQSAGDPAGIATVQNYSGGGVLDGTYFDVRSVIGDGVGYVNSYQQIGAFTPIWLNEDTFIAPNTRLIVTNSTQTGVNTGLVGRKYFDNLDRIFGVYGYYDNDQDSRNFRYSQFTVGAETLGQWWDLRANGYILNGMNNNFISAQGLSGNPFYFGNNIDFRGTQLRDQSLGGADAEFGVPLSPYTPWLRGYAGLYGYQTGGSSNTMGFRGRMEAMVSNDLTLGVTVSNDAIYGTNINGVIDFKFSGFLPTRYFPNMTTRQRMLNPVQRNWRIATRTYIENVNVAALNPATGQPYFIVHVDNTAPAGGNGTIEHPFDHLQNLSGADIILVHRGNATTAANAVTGSATLANNERLLGDGILSTVQLAARYGSSSIAGTFNLPGTSNSGIYPYVTNPTGNIVTLNNNNEVAGLILQGAGSAAPSGTAIANTSAGSNNFNLHDLEIFNNTGKGIDLVNASGVGIIKNINLGVLDSPTPPAGPPSIGNNTLGGIQISTATQGLNLGLQNVYMNASAPGAQAFGISLAANNGILNADLNNILANGNGTGILLSETSQNLAVSMEKVRANNSTGAGINIQGTGGSIVVDGTNVAAMGNGSDNLQIGTQAAPIVTSTVAVTFAEANFSNSILGSGIVFSQSGGIGMLNLPGSATSPGANVSGNNVNGLAIFGTNLATMTANIRDASFANNGLDAFHVLANTGSTVNLRVDPTDASNSGRDGLFYSLANGSVLNTTFVNDNLSNSGNSAVEGLLTGFSTVNLYFSNVTGTNSGGNGFSVNATDSLANLTVLDSNFSLSGRTTLGSSAISIFSNNSAVNLLADGTDGSNTTSGGTLGKQAYGLVANIQNGSVFNGAIENGDFSHSLVDAVNLNVVTGSNASLTLFNVDASHSGFDGVFATADGANTKLSTMFTNTNINNSTRNGMTFNVTNTALMTANLNGSTVDFSGASGLNFNVDHANLGVGAASSSFSQSGRNGVIGSGVLGVVNNSGLAALNFANTTINNNLDNGVFVTTLNSSNIQAAFSTGSISNNGLSGLTPRNNDGILLNMDGSPNSSLSVNGTQVLHNGNDGIAIVAADSTNFTGTFSGLSILNNGVALTPLMGTGAGINVTTRTGSDVDLTLNGATIGNTAGAFQQYGFLSNTSGASQMNASITSSNLSNNAIDAISSTLQSASMSTIKLANVTGDNSGSFGAIFNVTGGSQLNVEQNPNVGSGVGSSFSSSGGAGILVQVSGASSIANFELDSTRLNNNGTAFGGQGFNGIASGGGQLNAQFLDASITNNANQGIQLIATDAATTGSTMSVDIRGSTVDSNGSEGLSINVSNLAQVNYRSINSTYSSNGTNGALDGVSVTVAGNGPADSATALLLFAGGAMDNNTGNGLALNASNGATLTTSLDNISISNNGGYGILASATDANTKFNLLMQGTNTLTGNASGPIASSNGGPTVAGLVFANINQAVLEVSGSFDNSTGDGIHIDLQHIVNALVALNGPGTIDNSAKNGIFVNMEDITGSGTLLIDGFTSINNSGLNGIDVNFNNIASAAIQIQGPTTISGSGSDGIDLTLNDTNLVSSPTFGGADIQVLTLTSNQTPTALNNNMMLLPKPVTLALQGLTDMNGRALTPANAFKIDGINAITSGGTGINIAATNTNIAANDSFITNNVVSNSLAGDGLHLDFHTVTADGLAIENNGLQGNSGNGLNLELFNTPIDGLTITGNSGGSSFAAGTLDFTYNNLIWTTTMNNNSSAGFSIAQVSLDLNGTTPAQVWRPDLTPFVTPPGFEPTAPTDVTVGLDSVDGVAIAPGNYPVTDTNGNVLPFGGIPVGSTQMTLGFNNFTPGSQLVYSLSHDLASTVGGSGMGGGTLVGATGSVTLADGRTASGVFTNAGLTINQAFLATTPGISSNGLDGIRFNLNDSSLTNLNVTHNTISLNGQSSASGHGIEFTGAGGAVVNSDITNATINGNTISSNTGDGIRLVNPTTPSSSISASFTANQITLNQGTGINLSLVSGGQSLNSNFTNNTISQNTGGPGVNIHLANNANMTGDFRGNTISNNGAQGVNFNMGVNGVVTSNIINNTINGNAAEGINIALNTGGHFQGTSFFGNTIGSTTSPNLGMGVRLTVPDLASFDWNLGNSAQGANSIVGNAGAGVGINMSGSGSGNLTVQNTTISNTVVGSDPNFSGQGLAIILNNTATLNNAQIGQFNSVNSVATNDTTFSNNAGAGFSIAATGNATMQNLLITNVNSENNTGDGIDITRIGNPIFTGTRIQNSQIVSNATGIHILAGNALLVDDYTISNNQILTNTGDGILLDARFDAQIATEIHNNTINGNGGNGIEAVEQQNAPSDNRFISGTWAANTITNNTLNGIEISARSNINIGANTTSLNNVITGNGGAGIIINGVNASSNTVIQGNIIDSNRTNGITVNATSNTVTIDTNEINANTGNGVQLGGAGGSLTASIDNSDIRFNTGDGVNIINTAGNFDVTIGTNNPNGNDISDNLGHGIYILNHNFGDLNVTIDNNGINRNGLQGVYAVNSAGGDPNAANFTLGSVFDNSQMKFVMDNNSVQDNGHLSNSDTTGLYLLVGTNGASTSTTDPGGFASTASAANSITNANLTGRGGVLALVTNNIFGGNAGHDVSFQSFVSTNNPTTGTAWTDQNENPPNPANDVFDPTGYQTDPLARLDMQFTGNTGQDAAVTRSGAFYNTNDPVFKSRVGNNPAVASPGGPFTFGGRDRNAQRLASNAPPFRAPGPGSSPPGGNSFLYPGVGSSTFRVTSDSSTAGFQNAVTTFGSSIGLGGNFGELPFVWSQNLQP